MAGNLDLLERLRKIDEDKESDDYNKNGSRKKAINEYHLRILYHFRS